jgi:bla regulator protein BlaR1
MMFVEVGSSLGSIFTEVLRLSWQAAALTMLVLVGQWLAHGRLPARWRYNLWLLVIIRLLLPFSAQSPMSVFNVVRPSLVSRPTFVSANLYAPAGEAAPPREAPAATAQVRRVENEPEATGVARSATASLAYKPVLRVRFDLMEAAGWVWLAGVAGFWICIAWTTGRAMREVRKAKDVEDPEVLELFAAWMTAPTGAPPR